MTNRTISNFQEFVEK